MRLRMLAWGAVLGSAGRPVHPDGGPRPSPAPPPPTSAAPRVLRRRQPLHRGPGHAHRDLQGRDPRHRAARWQLPRHHHGHRAASRSCPTIPASRPTPASPRSGLARTSTARTTSPRPSPPSFRRQGHRRLQDHRPRAWRNVTLHADGTVTVEFDKVPAELPVAASPIPWGEGPWRPSARGCHPPAGHRTAWHQAVDRRPAAQCLTR